MTRKRVLRWVLSFAVIAGGTWYAYNYLTARASERVRDEIVKIADELQIPDDSRDQVRRMIEQAHEVAFAKALNLTADTGKKFDTELYVNTIFDELVRIARTEGNDDLADKIQEERAYIKFDVQEQ